MVNPLLLNNCKKRFLFKKIDFLDKRGFFFLGLGYMSQLGEMRGQVREAFPETRMNERDPRASKDAGNVQ